MGFFRGDTSCRVDAGEFICEDAYADAGAASDQATGLDRGGVRGSGGLADAPADFFADGVVFAGAEVFDFDVEIAELGD